MAVLDEKCKFGEVWNNAYEKPLFDKMIPALKLEKYQDVKAGYIKGGMSEAKAGKEAAKFVNNLFGGFNWDQLGRSQDFKNVQRVFILAPDWLQTNIRLGGNMVKSLTTDINNPAMSAYRKFSATAIGTYVLMNAINKMQSGHFMFENDPGHTFEIDTGTYTPEGRKK